MTRRQSGRAAAATQPPAETPLHRITRWQGGWAVWRNDGTILAWYRDYLPAVRHLEKLRKNCP